MLMVALELMMYPRMTTELIRELAAAAGVIVTIGLVNRSASVRDGGCRASQEIWAARIESLCVISIVVCCSMPLP